MKVCILGDARSVHVQRVSRGLAGRGIAITVITLDPAPIDDVEVLQFEEAGRSRFYGSRRSLRRERYLRDLLRGQDVVHLHGLHDWGLTEATAAGGHLVITPRGADIQTPPGEPPLSAAVIRQRAGMLRMADLVIAPCKSFAEQIVSFAGIAREQLRIVPNGVDTQRFSPAPHRAEAGPVVGCFKGFGPGSGVRSLIEAIPAISQHFPQVRFELIGDGPLLLECRRLAEDLGVEDAIHRLPPEPHERMPAHLARWSVVVVPSLVEASGVGALEAAAMELPVVATRVGGLIETVRDGLTGILVPPADPWHLAGAVIELLEDPERGRLMGRVGRRVVQEEYAGSRSLDALIRGYEAAVAQRVAVMAK